MNPFLKMLVDELVELDRGVRMWDAFNEKWFTMRAEVIMTITDMPGGHKLHKTINAGALANSCWICDQPGETVSAYHRVVYRGNEKFLPLESPLRALVGKPGEESEPPPRKKRKEELFAYGRAVDDVRERVSTGEATKRALEEIEKSTGKKGLEELHRLPYYDPVYSRPVEIMHALTVMAKKPHALMNGHVDPFTTLEAEQSLGRFTHIVGRTGGQRRGQEMVSHPPWALDKYGLEIADERCLQIQVPHGFGWKRKGIFANPPYMKSYEWMKISTCNIMLYAVRGLLGMDQFESLSKFFECLRDFCLPDISAKEAREMKTKTAVAVVEMERHWPLRINTTMMHMTQHVSDDTLRFGPARSRWMYGAERYNSFLSRRITKRDTPEVNTAEKIRIYDLTQQLSLNKLIPEGAIMTDPGVQLRAVTAARRDMDGPLGLDVADELEEESMVDEPSVPGLGFLTSQFRRPEDTTLSQEEAAMIATATDSATKDVSTEATRFYSARIRKPREQVLSCALVDKPKSGTCSSYIGGLSGSGNVTFGRILYYVHVCVNQTKHAELALVEWQPAPQPTEGMWSVNSREMPCHPPSFVECQLLPPPLVTAWASENILYFLDANVARMPTLPV